MLLSHMTANSLQALEEVQEFHQLDNSLQIRQFLAETVISLKQAWCRWHDHET